MIIYIHWGFPLGSTDGGTFWAKWPKNFSPFLGQNSEGDQFIGEPIFQLVGAIPTKGNALYIFFVQSRR